MIRYAISLLFFIVLLTFGSSDHDPSDTVNTPIPDSLQPHHGRHGMMGWMHNGTKRSRDSLHDEADAHSYEMFVHPFLTHMGIPDEPGEISLRITALQLNDNGNLAQDISFHIEAGITNNLGIHIRSDGINTQDFSEVMLQYAPWVSSNRRYGFAVFGQLNIPTGAMDSEEYRGLAGVSGLASAGQVMVFDGNVHYDFVETAAELESSFIFRLPYNLFPIIEARGHVGGEHTEGYLLPAFKWAIRPHMAIGAGFQFPITEEREYDIGALFTFDIAFE